MRPPRTWSVRQHRNRVGLSKAAHPPLGSPLVNAEGPRDAIRRGTVRHHQQRLPTQVDALLNLAPTQLRFHPFALLRRKGNGHRRAASELAGHP